MRCFGAFLALVAGESPTFSKLCRFCNAAEGVANVEAAHALTPLITRQILGASDIVTGASQPKGVGIMAFRNIASILVAAFGIVIAGSAFAVNSSGQPTGATSAIPVTGAYNTPALTYNSFSGTCSQAAFFTTATGVDNANGTIDISQHNTLNGVAFDTASFSLGTGPFTFPTSFGRTFTPPPPASSTYTFVFNSDVFQAGNFLGTSITTITCTGGVFSATNTFVAAGAVPTLSEWSLILLALMLAGAGVYAFRRQNARRS